MLYCKVIDFRGRQRSLVTRRSGVAAPEGLTEIEVPLGLMLEMDPRTERFVGNDKAGELLTRPCRPGLAVPAEA